MPVKLKAPKQTNPELLPVVESDLLHSGSTLLNLACTGSIKGAFQRGFYYLLVGDSDSGKTFLCMATFAEATLNKAFDDYRFIYDRPEQGMQMDTDTLFNEEVANRMEPPHHDKDGSPVNSRTIEDLYYNVDDALDTGKPFIYILDSMDGLGADADEKKFLQQKKAARKIKKPGEEEEKVSGSYGTLKAKVNSYSLRRLPDRLLETKSILIIISQTRDAIESYGKTRGGGRAMAFYASLQVWTSIEEKIKKNVRDKMRDLGSVILMEVKRNRFTGKRRSVTMDIYPSFGIDDVGACVDYLLDEKWWVMDKLTIDAKELGIKATREKLVRVIERDGLEADIFAVCQTCWDEVEAACTIQRKNKYHQDTQQAPE